MPTVYTPPVSTYTPLASLTLTSTDSEIVFSSIPASYRDLVVVFRAAGSSDTDVLISMNSDTTAANYSRVLMSGDGTTTYSVTTSPRNITYYGSVASSFGTVHIINFMDYSATDKHKTFLTRANRATSGVDAIASRWANTNAITSIAITANTGTFSIGSTFSLFGIAA